MKSEVYYWVGFVVFWLLVSSAGVGCAYYAAVAVWVLGLAKIDTSKHPWVLWTAFYIRRALGKYRYKKHQLQPPFVYNRSDMRPLTKEKTPVVRDLQANIIRYNRRRWLRA